MGKTTSGILLGGQRLTTSSYCRNHNEVPICECGQNTMCFACTQGRGSVPCDCGRFMLWDLLSDEALINFEEILGKTTMKWKIINFLETTKHKLWVAWYLLRVCWVLIKRAIVHDISKYSKNEAPYFEAALPHLRNLDYGSDEYQAAIKSLGPALDHHYQVNSHHPEHWIHGFYSMSCLDILEMLCDWKAAGKRHKNGNMEASLKINRGRFQIEQFWMEILRRDSREIGLIG